MNAVRLAPDDADSYVTLRREALLDAPWSFASSPEDDRGSDPAGVRRMLALDDFAVFAVRAEAGEQLLSVAMLNRESRVKRRHVAWLMGVYTTPAARGRGLASAVVSACVAHARTWVGVDVIQLGVSARADEAQRLYKRLGFVTWGIECDAIRIGDASFDELHMSLRLRQ